MIAKSNEKRIRKSTKYIYNVIAVCLIIFFCYNLLRNIASENMITKNVQIYSYRTKFQYDYNVNLVENEYIDKIKETEANVAYITDLIDNIDLQLNYQYNAQKQSNIECNYEVVGKMQAIYTKNGEKQKILEQEETLLEKQLITANTSDIKINEKLTVNLKEKNELLREFEQKMGMTIDANYDIILKINVKTIIEEKEIVLNASPLISIDLAEKTTQISGDNNKEDTQYISKEVENTKQGSYIIAFDIITIIIAVLLLRYANKSQIANRIKNEYKQELNRLLKLCQDKIVQVSTKPENNKFNMVYVKHFGEIVKVSEELFKPILYYYDQENEEAWFSVMNNDIVYQYILKK